MLYFEVVTEGVVLFRGVSGVQIASTVPKLDRTFFTGYYCRYCFVCMLEIQPSENSPERS